MDTCNSNDEKKATSLRLGALVSVKLPLRQTRWGLLAVASAPFPKCPHGMVHNMLLQLKTHNAGLFLAFIFTAFLGVVLYVLQTGSGHGCGQYGTSASTSGCSHRVPTSEADGAIDTSPLLKVCIVFPYVCPSHEENLISAFCPYRLYTRECLA